MLTPKMRASLRAKISGESLPQFVAEKAVLGTDHSEVGACLLQRWSFPEIIVEAVANHHAPVAKPAIKLSAVVYLANRAGHLSDTTPGREAWLAQANQMSAEALGLNLKKVEQFVSGIHSAMQTLPQFNAA
jgi:HD-like signal output (HDOD) protein